MTTFIGMSVWNLEASAVVRKTSSGNLNYQQEIVSGRLSGTFWDILGHFDTIRRLFEEFGAGRTDRRTNGRTDGRTDPLILSWTHLKRIVQGFYIMSYYFPDLPLLMKVIAR